MHLSMRLLATLFVAFGLARSSTAQSIDPWAISMLMKGLRIEEITDGPSRVVIRGSRIESDGRIAPDQVIICSQGQFDRWYLAVEDSVLRTDNRIPVGSGFCVALVAAARQHKRSQDK
jgi:hypothetical protein